MAGWSPNGATVAARVAVLLAVCSIAVAGFLLFAGVSDNGTDCGTFGNHKSWEYLLNNERIPSHLSGCDEAFSARETKVIAAGVAALVLFGISVTISRARRQ